MADRFGQRVRALLAKKNGSQVELSVTTGIPAPTISKILTSNAAPTQEQVLSIARALETTAVELAFGTDAQAIVEDWVPRAQLEAEAEERLRAQREVVQLTTRLEETFASIQSHEAAADRLRRDLSEKDAALQTALATLAASERRNEALEVSRAEALELARQKDLERLRANQQVQRLAAQLVATEGEVVQKAVVTGVLSFLGGVLSTGSTRQARPTTRRRRHGARGCS